MQQKIGNYVLVSPVRNEEQYIYKTIESIVRQTVRPIEYMIVDDGSTDRTAQIVKEAMRSHSWIRYFHRPDRGERKVGPGVIEAFYDGCQRLNTRAFNFIGKIDGDLVLGPHYFETLLGKFNMDKQLGAASGRLFTQLPSGKRVAHRLSNEMVVGAVQFIRRKCFEEIGGFVREVMWDGIAYHRCRMEGWRTRSFPDRELIITELRPMGASHKSIFHGRLRWGRGQYFMGTHPLYLLAVMAYRMLERPYFIGGLCILLGYIEAWRKKMPRYDFAGFRKSLHAWQFERLGLGKRLERAP